MCWGHFYFYFIFFKFCTNVHSDSRLNWLDLDKITQEFMHLLRQNTTKKARNNTMMIWWHFMLRKSPSLWPHQWSVNKMFLFFIKHYNSGIGSLWLLGLKIHIWSIVENHMAIGLENIELQGIVVVSWFYAVPQWLHMLQVCRHLNVNCNQRASRRHVPTRSYPIKRHIMFLLDLFFVGEGVCFYFVHQ